MVNRTAELARDVSAKVRQLDLARVSENDHIIYSKNSNAFKKSMNY